MPQTFSQNEHTLWSMWTFRSNWVSEKLRFFVVKRILERLEIFIMEWNLL